jgi:hypothetical protein
MNMFKKSKYVLVGVAAIIKVKNNLEEDNR